MAKRPIALVDMDGTLCDFDGAMQEELDKLRHPEENPTHGERMFEDLPHMKARRRLIKRLPGFWLNLKPLEMGFEILKMLEFMQFEIHILTHAPKNNPLAFMEKAQWCEKHLSDIQGLHIVGDKTLTYGKVLVDDWPKYFMGWLEHRPRGLVIAPAHSWNAEFDTSDGTPTHPQVLRYGDPKLGSTRSREISNALSKVRATADD